MSSYKLLCVGHHAALLEARSAMLARAGHDTKVATPYWAMMLLRQEYFDAIVLYHTMALWELRLLWFQVASLKRKIPVIQIYSPPQTPRFCFACRSGDPEELLPVVLSALNNRPAAATA
jgi:hypothetical protein